MVLDWGCFVYIYLQSLDIEYIHHLYPRSSCTNLYQKKIILWYCTTGLFKRGVKNFYLCANLSSKGKLVSRKFLIFCEQKFSRKYSHFFEFHLLAKNAKIFILFREISLHSVLRKNGKFREINNAKNTRKRKRKFCEKIRNLKKATFLRTVYR